MVVGGFFCVLIVYGGFQQMYQPGVVNKVVGLPLMFVAGSIIAGMFVRFGLGIDLSDGKDHW
jgi:hypothetical protein